MGQSKPKPPQCPICTKPPQERYRPFCSRRCADVDLHRWLSGGYAIPAAEEDDPDAEDHTLDAGAGQAKPDSL